MSRLEELIAEYCPDGVPFVDLGKVCEIRSGWGFPNSEQGKKEGEYPFYKVGDMNTPGNEVNMGVSNNYIDYAVVKKLKCKPAPEGTIIFPKIGAAIGTNKKRLLSVPSCYDNNVMGLIANNTTIDTKFLYYVFSTVSLISFADYSGAMPSIRKTTIETYKVPVPPLPVQREIVRILDNFTELTAELTAELNARKKQYEYYRNELLNNLNDNVPTVKIKDVFRRIKGTPITAGMMKEIEDPNGEIRIFAGGKTAINAKEESIPNANITHVPAVLVQSRGVIDAVYYDKPFTFKNEMWAYTNENIVSVKYLYYVLKNNIQYFRTAASGMGSLPQISLPVTEEYLIKFPTISEQEWIVNILDRFDTLCSDIYLGLPAEIEARQKQYEHYRDKLLTFKELKS